MQPKAIHPNSLIGRILKREPVKDVAELKTGGLYLGNYKNDNIACLVKYEGRTDSQLSFSHTVMIYPGDNDYQYWNGGSEPFDNDTRAMIPIDETEFKKIAKKYGMSNSDIRIMFPETKN